MIFRQSPEPGRMALSDFTDAGSLGVTIAHCRGVRGPRGPARRTDSLSAAYRNLDPDEALDVTGATRRSAATTGSSPAATIPAPLLEVRAHENGAVESHNGHLETALDQALTLRGGRDFATVDVRGCPGPLGRPRTPRRRLPALRRPARRPPQPAP